MSQSMRHQTVNPLSHLTSFLLGPCSPHDLAYLCLKHLLERQEIYPLVSYSGTMPNVPSFTASVMIKPEGANRIPRCIPHLNPETKHWLLRFEIYCGQGPPSADIG